MRKTHEQLVAEAKRLIGAIFGDDSVGWEKTLDTLEDLESEISGFITALREEHADEL